MKVALLFPIRCSTAVEVPANPPDCLRDRPPIRLILIKAAMARAG